MKRVIAAILAICYLCLSIGFTVQQHYCMGKMVGTSLIARSSENHDCKHCGMEKKSSNNGCCKDEYKIIKTKDEFAVSKIVFQCGNEAYAVLPVPSVYLAENHVAVETQQQGIPGRPHGPPFVIGVQLHVRNCVFLI